MSNHHAATEPRARRGLIWRALGLTGQVIVGAFIVSAVLFAVSTLRQPGTASDETTLAAPIPVEILTIVEEDGYTVPRQFVGRVVARQETSASFELPGRLVEILVDEGDSVRAGETVARLDTALLEASFDELQSRVHELEAQVELAVRTEERQQELNRMGHATDQRLDESYLERIALEAALEQARAAIRNVEIQIDKSTLRAPFNGSVGARMTDIGAVLQAGQPVLDIVETDVMEARIGIPAPLAERLDVGEVFEIAVGDRTIPGTLHALRRDIDRQTRTVTAVLVFGDTISVPSGEIARLTLERYHAEPGYWMPVAALTQGLDGLWSVFVARDTPFGDTVVQREEVEVLHFASDQVFVRGTVSSGDRVVSVGVERVTPGQRIVPLTSLVADNV